MERAIATLRAVAMLGGNATLAQVARATGLNRTTAYRLMRCLCEQRMLQFDDDRARYEMGPLVSELDVSGHGLRNIAARLRRTLQSIAQQTRLTTYLVARSGTEVVCLDLIEADAAVRAVPLSLGSRLPLGVGAGSLALLASLPDDAIDRIVASNESLLSVFGGGTLDAEEIRRRVDASRAQGYAFSQQSVATGICGIGLRVPSSDAAPELAISVSLARSTLDTAEQQRLAGIIADACAGARAPDLPEPRPGATAKPSQGKKRNERARRRTA